MCWENMLRKLLKNANEKGCTLSFLCFDGKPLGVLRIGLLHKSQSWYISASHTLQSLSQGKLRNNSEPHLDKLRLVSWTRNRQRITLSIILTYRERVAISMPLGRRRLFFTRNLWRSWCLMDKLT